jgi:hypothetical protein
VQAWTIPKVDGGKRLGCASTLIRTAGRCPISNHMKTTIEAAQCAE